MALRENLSMVSLFIICGMSVAEMPGKDLGFFGNRWRSKNLAGTVGFEFKRSSAVHRHHIGDGP